MTRKLRMHLFLAALLTFAAAASFGCRSSQTTTGSDERFSRPLATPSLENDRRKIVAFGDSLTAGFGLTEKESYPYLLQEMLRADGFDFEVVNAGVSGDTSLGGLERIDWVLDSPNIEVLILELGANDLLRGAPPEKMKANLESIIKKAKAKNVRVLLCGMLAPPSMGADYQREFNAVFPELATKYKLNFLPFLLERVALQKELNQADGIHPNAEGEKIMAKTIYDALRPMLVDARDAAH